MYYDCFIYDDPLIKKVDLRINSYLLIQICVHKLQLVLTIIATSSHYSVGVHSPVSV